MELTEGLSYYYGALRLQSPLNPPFTQGGTVWGIPFTQGGHGVGYPLYTRGACPLFAHASFLLIGTSLFLTPRTIRGFSLYKKSSPRTAESLVFFYSSG